MTFEPILFKFMRGVVYSKEEQSLYFIEANHQLFCCKATPENRALISEVKGAEFLQDAKVAAVTFCPVVSHADHMPDGVIQYCYIRFEFLTDKGCCSITVRSHDLTDISSVGLTCGVDVGYPPDDAKKLEDFSDD